ncbi:MAG: hypothetical protein CMN31_06550 [Sandaracinus sp.]|nr:hypothetical protein [Myxococcales bacterium]MAT28379.1 hypothetical protein [Sandaracinus sp.]MBJ70988.1 hypothetical protein [Sandaracinus sp.]
MVIEDGHEYEEFARLFLADGFAIRAAHSAAEALARLTEAPADAFLVDLRFERSPVEHLIGDVDATARRRFAGDVHRAVRYLKEQQGTLVLGRVRQAGFDGPAVFVHDFAARRLANLRKLYGDVHAVPAFDAEAIRRALTGGAP